MRFIYHLFYAKYEGFFRSGVFYVESLWYLELEGSIVWC